MIFLTCYQKRVHQVQQVNFEYYNHHYEIFTNINILHYFFKVLTIAVCVGVPQQVQVPVQQNTDPTIAIMSSAKPQIAPIELNAV